MHKESVERAKKIDVLEELKVDLTDETVRLLKARRKRTQNTFTDFIVKETDRVAEEIKKEEANGHMKSAKKAKDDSIEDGDDGRLIIETEYQRKQRRKLTKKSDLSVR